LHRPVRPTTNTTPRHDRSGFFTLTLADTALTARPSRGTNSFKRSSDLSGQQQYLYVTLLVT